MSRNRRVLAVLCIALIAVTTLVPATAGLLCADLAPLAPLFGTVVSGPVAPADVIVFAADPLRSVLPSRAPPSLS